MLPTDHLGMQVGVLRHLGRFYFHLLQEIHYD